MEIDVFDPYEIRARIMPALIVISPYSLIAISIIYELQEYKVSISVSIGAYLLIGYFFSFIVRDSSKGKEEPLWESWGGKPSTRFLHADDKTFDDETKAKLRGAVKSAFDIDMVDDDKIDAAFKMVRQYIRKNDPRCLWYSKLAEYGFIRNLWGSYKLFIINAVASCVVCFLIGWRTNNGVHYAFSAVSILLVGIGLVSGIWILPLLVKSNAVIYAENAWLSFLNSYASRNVSSRQADGGEP